MASCIQSQISEYGIHSFLSITAISSKRRVASCAQHKGFDSRRFTHTDRAQDDSAVSVQV
jgi:hypothetical protein